MKEGHALTPQEATLADVLLGTQGMELRAQISTNVPWEPIHVATTRFALTLLGHTTARAPPDSLEMANTAKTLTNARKTQTTATKTRFA